MFLFPQNIKKNRVYHLCKYNVEMNAETFQTILYRMIAQMSQAAYFNRPVFTEQAKQELRYFRILYDLVHYNQKNFSGSLQGVGVKNSQILANGIVDFLMHALAYIKNLNHKIFLCGIACSSEFLVTDWKSTKPRNKRREILDEVKSLQNSAFEKTDQINDKGLSGIGIINDSLNQLTDVQLEKYNKLMDAHWKTGRPLMKVWSEKLAHK